MSETERRNKDGEDKNKTEQRQDDKNFPDERQNADRAGVKEEKGPDSFDEDLKRTS